MFKKIHQKLTLYYTGIMAVFFIILVFSVHISMVWSITSEQEHEVLLYAEEEAIEHAVFIQHRELLEQEKSIPEGEEERRLFFYAYDLEGNLVNAAAPQQAIEDHVLVKIRNWQEPMGTIVTLQFDDEYKLMLAAMPVLSQGEQIGTVYVGRDVTTYYKGMRMATTLVVIVSVIALFIAAFAGYIMAGRAIVPIKRAYERQREFAADASHELRTPLSVIMSSVEVMQQVKEFQKNPFIAQLIDDMKDEAKKMSNLVTDLLTLARGDYHGNTLQREIVRMDEVVAQAVRKVQPLAEQKGIQIEFTDLKPYAVCADLERMKQLMLILLDNAIKYTPSAGRVTIEIKSNIQTKRVLILVSDTGIGIDSEDWDQIFERFYRVDKARSRDTGGSGLGLSIAKWIVLAHRGEIRVESKKGEGATFIVALPK